MSKVAKGLSPKHVRNSHLCRSTTHKCAPVFPLATQEQYDAMTNLNKKKFRQAARRTVDKLDQLAAEEKTSAQKNLFRPCSWADPRTCQTDHGPQAGSSHAHAAICSPNKKTKAEPKGWSPDSTQLPAKHPRTRPVTACAPAPHVRRLHSRQLHARDKKYDPVD